MDSFDEQMATETHFSPALSFTKRKKRSIFHLRLIMQPNTDLSLSQKMIYPVVNVVEMLSCELCYIGSAT